jgi:DTW domain-containing protein YfiP
MRSHTPPNLDGRCPRCFFPTAFCLCERVPRVGNRTEFVIVRHSLERMRSSNTARWAALALSRCTLVDVYGDAEPPHDLAPLVAGAHLLFPGTNASAPPEPRPTKVVVVDGSWSQARHMVHRLAELRPLPRLSLGPPAPGSVRLRQPKVAAGMSTLEAIAQALALLDEPEAANQLESLHRMTVDQAHTIRGRRST